MYSGAILPGSRVFNNLAYGDGGDYRSTSGTVIDFARGNLIADALFQDANNDDYRSVTTRPSHRSRTTLCATHSSTRNTASSPPEPRAY